MEQRLIDADALKMKLQYVYSCDYIGSKSKEGIVSDIIDAIDNAPTIEPKKDEIRWTDKVTLDANGNIRDFNGNIYGADMRGGA